MTDDGVLVLMDLGSALMSAEMAIEMLESDGPVVMSEAPHRRGCGRCGGRRARAARHSSDVRAEARGAIAMKEAQLGVSARGAGRGCPDFGGRVAVRASRCSTRSACMRGRRRSSRSSRLATTRTCGCRRRAALGRAGPVNARSLTGLMTLVARKGDELIATASGPQADEALAALEELARGGFGEGVAGNAALRRRRRRGLRRRRLLRLLRRGLSMPWSPSLRRGRRSAASRPRPGSRSGRCGISVRRSRLPRSGPRRRRCSSGAASMRRATPRARRSSATATRSRGAAPRAMPRSSMRTWRYSTTRLSWTARVPGSTPATLPSRPGTRRASRRRPRGGRSTTSSFASGRPTSRTSGAACWQR